MPTNSRSDKARRAAETFLKHEREGCAIEVRDVAARFGMTSGAVSAAIRRARANAK